MKILLYLLLGILIVLTFVKRSDVTAFLATAKYYGGKKEKGLRLFEIADKIGTLSPENRMKYGYALLRVGQLEKASQLLNSASMASKNDAFKKRVKSILALVVWKEGNLDGSIEMLEEVAADFKTTATYQNLGLLYVLKGDADKALKFNLEAYDYSPDDLIILDNLAEAYVLSGNTEKAALIYEEILEKEPHFPEPYYNYGLLLIEKGEKERGINLIRESLTKTFSFLSVHSKEYVENLLREKEQL